MFEKTCTNCNKIFRVERIEDFNKYFHKAKLGKFGFTARCSKCRHNLEIVPNRAKKKEYDKKRNKTKGLINTCIVCGKDFPTVKHDAKTCSLECFKIKRRVYQKMHRKENIETILKNKEKELLSSKKRNFHYTDEEKHKILKMRESGKTIVFIAKKLGRTQRGISYCLAKMRN